MFPKKTAERDDFERIVRTIDEMFYSEENAKLWCLGVEGETYTMDGDKIVYSDDIVNSADGIYKSMQLKYGCGSDVTQMVWINEREMSKYDENYAEIKKTLTENGYGFVSETDTEVAAKLLDMTDERADVMKTFTDYTDEVPVQFIRFTVSFIAMSIPFFSVYRQNIRPMSL